MTVHALKRKRYIYLFAAAISFLVLGLVYAWSLFATPLAEIYSWDMAAVKVTFTICMMAFCVGGLIGVRVLRRLISETASRRLRTYGLKDLKISSYVPDTLRLRRYFTVTTGISASWSTA